MDDIDNIRSIVKEELLKTFGQEILYAKDCQILSVSILQKTNRQISSSTLKRLFGIIHSPYNLSKYTLDTLAIYLNYTNWDALKNSFADSKPSFSEQDYWTLLKKRIQIVSSHSLTSMKAKLGNQFSDFQGREFAINKFETFLNSPYLATAFIAPGGYGKTTIVAQLVELFFTGPHARYPKDIVCLVDGSILTNLVNLNLEVVRLKNIIEFEQRNSFSIYFRKHPEQVKGRFVLIIESLYQIYHQEEKLNNFIENLMDLVSAYEDVSWFKLLITCRPDNWKNFSNLILKNPHLESKWFDVHFGGSATDSINVPLLSKSEIMYFLNKRHSAKRVEQFKFHYPDVTETFNNPYLLQLFSTIQNPKGIHTDLELLDYFVSEKILTEPYLEEKSTIISAFFKFSNYLKKSSSVNKADLPTSAEYSCAYRELIFNNLLYEFTISGQLSVSENLCEIFQ